MSLRSFATLALLLSSAAPLLLGCGPLGPFPGGPLRGEVVVEPVSDWSFSDEHMLIQVETRPSFPHSITTICFTHRGKLYVPAADAAGKRWPFYVLQDPHVRVKIGDKIYPGRAVRVTDARLRDALITSAGRKYEQISERDREQFDGLWVFRIDPLG
jgi:hypothetical protein